MILFALLYLFIYFGLSPQTAQNNELDPGRVPPLLLSVYYPIQEVSGDHIYCTTTYLEKPALRTVASHTVSA